MAASGRTQPAASVKSNGKHAKCFVSDDALCRKYKEMASDFLQSGVKTEAISKARPFFTGVDHIHHSLEAKAYAELDEPLPPNAVRLLVLPLGDAPEMSSLGAHPSTLTPCCSNIHAMCAAREALRYEMLRGSGQ